MVTIYVMELTPEQLEKLAIAEEAYYADMDSLTKPNSFMQEQFTPEQLEKLSISEEAYYADMDMAEISSEPPKPASLSRAEQKLKIIEKAKKTALDDTKRKTNLSVGTVVNTSKTNTLVDDLIDYGDDFINFENFDDEIDYADDMYSGMINTKPVTVGPGSPARATSSVITTTSRSGTTKNIIKGVETATDLVSSKSKINLKTAFAASTLGLAGGYMANRNRTRR